MLGQERKSQGRLSLGQLEKQPQSMFVYSIIIFFSSKVERNLKHYTNALGGHLIQKLLLYYNLKEQIATGGSRWVLFQG